MRPGPAATKNPIAVARSRVMAAVGRIADRSRDIEASLSAAHDLLRGRRPRLRTQCDIEASLSVAHDLRQGTRTGLRTRGDIESDLNVALDRVAVISLKALTPKVSACRRCCLAPVWLPAVKPRTGSAVDVLPSTVSPRCWVFACCLRINSVSTDV